MSQSHRAVVATAANVLEILDRPTPAPAAGQVSVRVAVSGVNPVDAHVIAGAFGPQLFPYVAGCEYSGSVIAVGDGVTDFAVGDRVAAAPKPFMGDPGGWQDVTVVDASALAKIPATVSEETAGTVPLLALTALTLARAAGLTAGQRAVIPGAGGGVGRWLTQLLLADGVEVTTVTSARDVAELAGWGADAVDRDNAEAVTSLADFDALFDVAGGDEAVVELRRTWVSDTGRYLSVSVQGEGIEFLMVQWDGAALATLLEGVAAGTFHPVSATLYAPEAAADAIADFTSRAVSRAALDLRVG